MKLQSHPPLPRQKLASGYSLVEFLVAAGLSSFLCMSIATLTVFTARSFAMVDNYMDLNSQSRNAVDILSREIRDSSSLVAFQTNAPMSLTFSNATPASSAQSKMTIIKYDSKASALIVTRITATGTFVRTNLIQCDLWTFSLYNRVPCISSTNVTFYSATNYSGQLDPTFCKVVNMTWKCSRKILGLKLNTEDVQTAQVVLRNKVR